VTRTQPPPTSELTYEQYSGRACCWCAKKLSRGAVSAGISKGSVGAHRQDIEVYACPDCAHAPTTRTRTGKN
jgi:hypothetical protein